MRKSNTPSTDNGLEAARRWVAETLRWEHFLAAARQGAITCSGPRRELSDPVAAEQSPAVAPSKAA